MFIQVIQGTVTDNEHLKRQMDLWRTELKPGARGYLGSVAGTAANGQHIAVVLFDSELAARTNSQRPEQGDWWRDTEKGFKGDVTFTSCRQVDVALGGIVKDAGFVQIIQGQASDKVAMRQLLAEMEPLIRKQRPDVLGTIFGWDDNNRFTQAVFFKSVKAARKAEEAGASDNIRERFIALSVGERKYLDLENPDIDT